MSFVESGSTDTTGSEGAIGGGASGLDSNLIAELASLDRQIYEITAIYEATVNQSPSSALLGSLTQTVLSGTPLSVVQTNIANTAAEVTTLYEQVYGRQPDPAGLAGTVSALLSGTPVSTIRASMAGSPESQTRLTNAYTAVYGEAPSAAVLEAAIAALAGGETLQQVEAPWATQATAEVNALYQQALGRNADPGGLEAAVETLLNGTPLSSVLSSMADSPEETTDLTAAYQQVLDGTPPQDLIEWAESQIASGQSQSQTEDVLHDAARIVGIYETVFGNNIDGAAPWLEQLEAGQPALAIEIALAGTPQALQVLSTIIEAASGTTATAAQLQTAQALLASGASVQAISASVNEQDVPRANVWLSAIPPVNSSLLPDQNATQDFMQMVASGASWDSASLADDVFSITSQEVALGSDSDLQAIFSYLNEHHIALALQAEDFFTPGAITAEIARIAGLGGNLQYIWMDEPLYYQVEDPPAGGTSLSISQLAANVAENVTTAKAYFPNVQIGDAEPVPGVDLDDITAWLAAYRAAVGEPISFFAR
jgi:hypothetical protein